LATGGDSGSLKELALAGLEAVSDCFSPSSFRYDKKLAPTSALAEKKNEKLKKIKKIATASVHRRSGSSYCMLCSM